MVVLHIDMDAFFAAIEQRDNPALRQRPVIVGADPKGGRGRGVVSACSYEARPYGVHSAMPISTAYRLCPHAVFLPVDGKKYSRVSKEIFAILAQFTPDVESLSIDEAFLDITGTYHFYKTPRQTGLKIKDEIKKRTGLTASVGIAPNKMLAKIASDVSKPDGLLEVKPEEVLTFLKPLPVERLWGVGPKVKAALNQRSIMTIGDLAKMSPEILFKQFGENGLHLFELSHGRDERRVSVEEDIKSVSHEHTFEEDTDKVEEVYEALLALSEKVSRRLRKYQLLGKTITVKIRLKSFKTYTRAVTLAQRTNFADTIYEQAKELLEDFYRRPMQFRLIGVRVSGFHDPYVQESLFEEEGSKKKEELHRALDQIKDKFGETAIHRGYTP